MKSTRTLGKSLWMLAVALFVAVAPAEGQIESATVMVEGLACPFCVFGIEKRLKKVEGVGGVDVDIKSGEVSLRASEGESIAVVEIPGAVEKAGFTAGAIHLTAVGTVDLNDDERALFRISESAQEMLLVAMGSLRGRIEELAAAGVPARIQGELHLHRDEPPGLEPDAAERAGT